MSAKITFTDQTHSLSEREIFTSQYVPGAVTLQVSSQGYNGFAGFGVAITPSSCYELSLMNPFERKVIHSALSENEHVKTESEGVEPNRYVVVIPDNLKANGDKSERYEKRSHGKRDSRGRKDRGEKPEVIKLEKKTIGFGTFLGNSLKED
jgi:hypothetical protein